MALELTRQRKIAYGIVAVLAVLLVGVLVYTQLVGGSETVTTVRPAASIGGLRADEASQAFDVGVLKSPDYTGLNRALLDAQRLPVPPPAARGKPNPFGV